MLELFLGILQFGLNSMMSNDIDLHGKFYKDIDQVLEEHFYNNLPPFKIITGNSSKMKKKVLSYIDENGYKYMSGNLYNQGFIQVL